MGVKRVGVYGGTFDPPHEGHIAVAKAAICTGIVDEIWMLVSPRNPLKPSSKITDDNLRLQMLSLALNSSRQLDDNIRSKIIVSDFEFNLPKPSYTFRTLTEINANFPNDRFVVITGGDNLQNFHLWKYHDEILHDYGLIVYPREGFDLHVPDNWKNYITILQDVTLHDVSASELRDAIGSGNPLPGRLTSQIAPEVVEFARTHNLYAGPNENYN